MECESGGAGQRPVLDGGLWEAAVLISRTTSSEVADQAAFFVALVIQGLGEHLNERSVRAGGFLGVQDL